MRIAITGARGFIGMHVAEHLTAHGHEITRLGRSRSGGQQRLVDQETSSSSSSRKGGSEPLAEIFADVDAVLHLAGRSVDSLNTPLSAYLEPNVALTEQVALAAAEASVGRVVFASSRMVYPSWLATGQTKLNETCPYPPDSFYGLSKVVAEQVLALHAQRAGFTAVALRIAQVTGPGDGGRGALPRMVEQAVGTGEINIVGSGAAVRDFVDVRDLNQALERALVVKLPVDAPTLVANVGTGGYSVREMAEEVARQTGLASGRIVHGSTREEDRSVYRLDCSVAARVLQWKPQRGLAEMVRDRLEVGGGAAS